ncbi:glycosyltransferase family 2 protein [Corynebacterium freiburgense]|uniref:glycosyltransferase family 2 protein n=1 Tax=Corynebacterium freiburgense TaxID=556548 RepID=UPI00047AB8DF|nr:glycosyltransferase family A protein [Corynebacterium freiburgense]WJZ03137.1 hypothetical protein CFREI_09295 [Corynebacterium freiburgense]
MQTYGVAIPMLRPSEHLQDVLKVLSELECPPVAVAINDQSNGDEIAKICERFKDKFDFLVRTTKTDPTGISSSRNGAIAAIVDKADWVCVVDDDSLLENPPISRIEEFGNASAIAGHFITTRVPASADHRFIIDRHTIWTHVIESGLFLRASLLQQGMLFDETLGTGGPTPWQSGEGTDLLFRFMQYGPVMYDPEYKIHATTNEAPDFPIAKHRRYARGTGYVLRRWCPISQQVRAILGPLLRMGRAVVQRDFHQVKLHANIACGRFEGLIGRTLSKL